jgi:acyl dehydratase
MPALAFEDLKTGETLRFGAYAVTEEEILAFAREFDPQPFHLDPGRPGGLIASGWHTCSMLMRMCFDGYLEGSTSAGAPGIDFVEWLKPVRPGMTLRVEQNILGKRVSRSRPDLGLVPMLFSVLDQNGDVLMRQKASILMGRRDPSAPIPPDEGEPTARREPPPEPPALNDAAQNLTRFATRYEDVAVGARVELGSYEFTRDSMLRFSRKYDPQPFHVDDAAAAKSHFGKLAASGWHTAGAYMRCFIDARERIRLAAAARGAKSSTGRPSPGFTDLRWARPVFVGDILGFETTVVGKRPSSKAGFGKIFTRARGYRGGGELVFEQHGVGLVAMDGGA